MLLAALADEPGGGGGVTWQQGTFDPYKYGEMYVNGKLVRSGPSASGDSFWNQGGGDSSFTTDDSRKTPAPPFKTPEDAVVKQYVPTSITPIQKPTPRTEYVTAQPSYYNLDSIIKSFIGPEPKKSEPQKQPSAPKPSISFPTPVVRQSNIQRLELPTFNTASSSTRKTYSMMPVFVMGAAGLGLLLLGISLLRKKA